MKSPPYLVNLRCAHPRRFLVTLFAVVALLLGARGRHAHAVTPATSVRTVALTGLQVPGAPGGGVFREFNQFYFSLNVAGQAAFLGNFINPDGSGVNEGIWSEGSGTLALVAREGEHPPGTTEFVRYDSLAFTALNNAGQTAFWASTHEGFLVGGRGIWSDRSGPLSLVARDGSLAPGVSGDVSFIGFGTPMLNDLGQTAFHGELTGSGVDGANREGIWSEGSGSLTLVAREGSQAIGLPVGIVHDILGAPALNDAGQTAFYGYVVDETQTSNFGQAVWSEGSGSLALVTRSGNQAPGTPSGKTFAGFSDPAFNNSGHTAFWAYLAGPGPLDPYDDGIWVESASGLQLAARRGSAAPGLPAGVTFGNQQLITFDSPVLSDSGAIVFRGFVSGPGVLETNDEGLWSGPASDLQLLAREGDHAPGMPAGVAFESFFPWNGALQMNALGQSVFTAFLRNGDVAGGIGIWATDVAGALHKIVATGDSLEIAPGDIRTVIDLSFINDPSGGSDGRSRGINNPGQIAFWAKFAGGDEGIFVSSVVAVPEPAGFVLAAFALVFTLRRGRLMASMLCALNGLSFSTAANAAQYIVTDLGALGGTVSLAWSINSSGQVSGYATTAGDVDVKAFLWNPTTPNSATGVMYDLDTLGGSFSWGTGINAAGQVVGVSATTEDAAEHATLWNPTVPNGSTGTLYDLETLGGLHSQANAANATGQVTGVSGIDQEGVSHAFLWNPTMPNGPAGTMHDIGSLGGSYTIGWDINASGSATGDSQTLDDEASHAFLWKPTIAGGTSGVMHDLGTLGGTDSGASGLNSAGQVAGWSSVTDDEAVHAFLWMPTAPGDVVGAMLDLGTLGGSDSYAYAVNSAGHVVGLSYVPLEVSNNGHAFLYTAAGGMVDLNALIDPLSGWELLDADDINNAGQIAGQGLINGEYHAFLLTPIPPLPGDFDDDGQVDAADLAVWQLGFGAMDAATHADGDADGDSDVDGADILVWQRQLGGGLPSVNSSVAVPEPSTWALLTALFATFRRFRQGGAARL